MNRSFQAEEYKARINRVMDHIEANLDAQLSLGDLARVANFSPFHFHRIFTAFVGETLNAFIGRIRIEKAAAMLVGNPRKTITEIAFETGFSGSASFARSFKESFGMSASQWRTHKTMNYGNICKQDRKNGKSNSNTGKDIGASSRYIYSDTRGGAPRKLATINKNTGRKKAMFSEKNVKVEVRNMPAMTVAYIRYMGPYKGNEQLFRNLWERLMTWAGPRGLLEQPDMKCLSVYHDDPEITDEKNLRTSVCITVPADTKVDGEIGKMEIAAGKYAAARFEIDPGEYQEAWNYVFGEWLPRSGYQPSDGPCFELYCNNPEQHPQHKHIVEICVPVKPL